jgi:hypothetical protein
MKVEKRDKHKQPSSEERDKIVILLAHGRSLTLMEEKCFGTSDQRV